LSYNDEQIDQHALYLHLDPLIDIGCWFN